MFACYKCDIIVIELTFLKELMLIKQVHQKSVIFVNIGISSIIILSFNQIYSYIKMGKNILTFGNIKIEKNKLLNIMLPKTSAYIKSYDG